MGAAKEYDDDMTLVVLKWHGIDLGYTASASEDTRRKPAETATLTLEGELPRK